MNIKKSFLSVLMISAVALSALAGTGKEAILTASSESGKAKLNVKIWDVYDAISKAELITPDGTFDLAGYDAYKVIDLSNHIFTICFSEKGKPADAPDTKVIKVWGVPSSFVKTAGGQYSWRFRVKVQGPMFKDAATLNATFDWNP